ncbi:hypothetical protein L3Q82_006511 [Scortum barcoo]|uniref:Uncharacterized protein n=1 Tax=Scortum barcoo TaxID=214431 RepID=A0ACB8WZW7_9TELE|nr:hypothetical protein L3Q82_006511 [Scortum barcoo]
MASPSPHDRSRKDEDEDDPVEQMISRTGCAEQHYAVQECMAEHQDWRACQNQYQQEALSLEVDQESISSTAKRSDMQPPAYCCWSQHHSELVFIHVIRLETLSSDTQAVDFSYVYSQNWFK